MRVPLPVRLTRKISTDAVAAARNRMSGWGWSDTALQALQDMSSEGLVGIRTELKYLMFQERGTRAFLMWKVAGKTIPMGCKMGDGPHFRRGGHVGEPGYVDIPHVGKVWRNQRWRHPGLKPRNFMADGLRQAIEDNQPLVQQWAKSLLSGSVR